MIAITGCNGLVGGYLYNFLCKYLINKEVLGFSTNPSINFVKLVDGVPCIDLKTVEILVHCGGTVGNMFTKEEHEYANIKCMSNLLHWAEQNNVKQFIYFSTGGVYGQNKTWVTENQSLNPENFYSESKIIAEQLLLKSEIAKKTIIRLYFPIGATTNNLFYKLMKKVATSEIIELNENGQPFISPICCQDVGNTVLKIINNDFSGIYNLSSNQKINIEEIALYFAEVFNVKVKFQYNDSCVDNYLGNSDKILKNIGIHEFSDLKKDLYDFSKKYDRGLFK